MQCFYCLTKSLKFAYFNAKIEAFDDKAMK